MIEFAGAAGMLTMGWLSDKLGGRRGRVSVMSLDLTTKKAVGTAAGFVGTFGYVGRVIQGKGLGWLAQHYGWDPALWAVLGCTMIGIILLACLWNVRPRG